MTTMELYPSTYIKKTGFDLILEAAVKQTFTVYGQEKLNQQHPSSNQAEIKNLMKLAQSWTNLLQRENTHPLQVVDDIRPILSDSRIKGSVLPLEDFLVVLENARLARLIIRFFDSEERSSPEVKEIINKLTPLKTLEDEIQRIVTENGTLRDDASKELTSIRGKLNRKRSNLRSTINRVMKKARDKGMSSDEGPTIRNGRMVVPIQAEFKRKVDGFIHDLSSTGQTVYIEPVEALQINNDIRELEAAEQREIERIIRELTSTVRKYSDQLYNNIDTIATLDALHGRVQLGLKLEGTIPQVSEDGNLNLINARNPNLVLKNKMQSSSETVVPLNLSLSTDELGLIITGPNAGGKSVAMKTVGLLSLMLQMGYPIPVQTDSELPVCSGLFIDVGDDQSIENDLSTFSSRLQWMRQTLERVKPSSLVLIDEAGTGTDPDEGGALFHAFIEKLIDINARVIGTTHHGSLKVFAHEHKNVVNGAMEFDQKTLSPTYRFRKGVPGSSYAFEIADRMDLQKMVMNRARELLGDQRNKMGELLVSLEKSIQNAKAREQELSKLRKETEKQEKKLRNKKEDLDRKTKKKLEEAYREAEEIMKTANQRIEAAVEKIVSAGKEDRETIREARRDVLDTKKSIRKGKADLNIQTKPDSQSKKPKVGDYVSVGESGTTGEVVDISGKQATILVNGMKIKSRLNKIQTTNAPKKEKKSGGGTYGGSDKVDLNVKPKLDIRGFRGDEAEKALMHYLDKATARGLQKVEIVHGKGEGILKKLVHQHLEKRDEVKSYNLAPWEHGGPGCTLVELK